MRRYPHWTASQMTGAKLFWASIAKIDEEMRRDAFRWALCDKARQGGYADFKPGKLSHWKNVIRTGGQIISTELTIYSADHFGVMDGRHRIYALHDEGFTDVLIQILPLAPSDLVKIERLAERLAS